jgi:hypothetical protein
MSAQSGESLKGDGDGDYVAVEDFGFRPSV